MKYIINGEELVFTTILEDSNNPTIFRHFKNKYYQILTIAKDSNTLDDIVVYKAMYGDYGIWIRDAKDFFSNVDKLKYKDVSQIKRFQIVDRVE